MLVFNKRNYRVIAYSPVWIELKMSSYTKVNSN